ncbi:proto-oncogene Mas-like [Eublepharis macularius]|uniref:Proto-oncogene Mas-like n=1 Tax=Eublepharis macularius TaxID=481883 RepID=A0AA97JRD3_EUBMA|nr:proto-oncogene Mas-like [Eublepharis macularius]
MTNFSNTSLSPVENERVEPYSYTERIISIFLLCISIVGLLGNGTVIYLLGFRIKRSPFTTYILNLAVADFGFLLFGSLLCILMLIYKMPEIIFDIVNIPATFMYVTSQLLLTAISIDRCVSILFPIWYRCHRPTHWSTTVCALIWVLTCLPPGISAILYILKDFAIGSGILYYPLIVSSFLCLPLVTVSTAILLFKVSCKSQQPQRRRLLTIILLTLLFFLIFAFPLSAINTIYYFYSPKYAILQIYGAICTYLNSFVNPVIYYMIGRKKKAQQKEILKVILQRAFKEEEEDGEEGTTTTQTEL